jgi:hypothetical protein
MSSIKRTIRRPGHLAACGAAAGLVLGLLLGQGLAETAAPSEHKGLEVEKLGLVPADSMAAQVGLDGSNPAGKSPNTATKQVPA